MNRGLTASRSRVSSVPSGSGEAAPVRVDPLCQAGLPPAVPPSGPDQNIVCAGYALLLETAWVSDRTLCYLASGKPAIVQHTGSSRFLPDADGLFRFRNAEGAARYLNEAKRDYDRHCRAARRLAEEQFDANRVVAKVLERALA